MEAPPTPNVVVMGEAVPENEFVAKTLDEDLAALLSLGLQLSDVERLWRQNKQIDMSDVYAAGTRLLAQPGKPVIARQASVSLEIARRAPDRALLILPELAELLRNELDEPPDEFRDPVMLTLMREPMVISSGHVFDRDTVYDRGAFRFQACPMTRQRIKDHAFPLVYLKAKIVDFKLRRIDGILGAVTANVANEATEARQALGELLDLAYELLSSLGKDAAASACTYQHRAATYYTCRRQLSPPEAWPSLLRELGLVSEREGEGEGGEGGGGEGGGGEGGGGEGGAEGGGDGGDGGHGGGDGSWLQYTGS